MSPHTQRLVHDSLLQAAARSADKTALVSDGVHLSYGELSSRARRLAAALQARGLQRGDRVAIYMENSWATAVAVFATSLAGGVFVVVNPQTKRDKLAYILHDSGATVLLADGRLGDEFLPAIGGQQNLRAVLHTGLVAVPEVEPSQPLESFEEVIAHTEPHPAPPCTIPLDLAALIYTSGSTGAPKGVMMTHQAMVFTAGSVIEYLRLGPEHRILNVLPLAFDYGLYQLLMSVRLGATLVLERSFAYPAQVLKQVREQHVTVFPGVPTIYALLLTLHRKKRLSFPSVTRVTNTAAALPKDFLPRLKEVFPNALIFKMYGLTECKRVCYLEPEELERKPASVGRAIPGTETFVLTPDGRPARPGEVGVLHVRGPHVMLGYWRQPERSHEMLKTGLLPGERVLCTQDFFRTDEDGYLYFVGRNDDIIKTRGEKVSPIEVENVLHGIDGVREAAVIGVPDPVLGEAIQAYVALGPGMTLSARDIQRACAAQLESFMVPQQVVFLPELPKTATGKIRKRSLREMGAQTCAPASRTS